MNWEVIQYPFVQNAAAAGFCAGIACSIAGVFVITTHLSFLGVCIAHAAFAGALMALWLGFDAVLGALFFSLLAAGAIGPLADRGQLSADTSTGIIFSFMLGLAFLFLGFIPGSRTEALSLFWGSILTLTRRDVWLLAGCAIGSTALVALFYKEVQAVLCHRQVALAVGIPAGWIFYGMLFTTGATIALSLRCIGGLLIYSLVLNPASAAFQLTYNLRLMFILAAVFGVVSCWAGLAASHCWDLPAGACIVLASTLLFALSLIFSPKRKASKWNSSQPSQ